MKAFRRLKKIFYSRQVKKIDLGKGLNLFNKFVFTLNVIFAILLLIACGGPIFNIVIFPSMAFLSLGVPVLAIVHVLFLGYWLILRHKIVLLSLLTLIIGYVIFGTFFKVYGSSTETSSDNVSILTFNSLGFGGNYRIKDSELANNIVDFIAEQDADIVCFQEFDDLRTGNQGFQQYPYYYINREFGINNDYKLIQAIFSKYPIIDKGSLSFPNSNNNAIYADIFLENDTLRIYNLHLQSLNVRPGSIKRESPSRLNRRLGNTFIQQRHQADLVVQHSKDINHRKIICGDFNNSQFSNVYYRIKQDMKDTFMEKGFGLGSTYIFKFLPFRIDYILVDPEIEIKSHRNFDVQLSDHTPIMASFRLKE